MTLFQATLITGIFLIFAGGHYLWHGPKTETHTKAFPRSQSAAFLLLGTAAAWFLCIIMHLGPADFGQYKHLLFLIFLVTAVGSFYYVPDFLVVRGLAALILLISSVLLDAAYMQESRTRLFLVTFVYLMIALSIYLGASPYRLRDFFDWVYEKESRPRVVGGALFGYGVLLVGITLTY